MQASITHIACCTPELWCTWPALGWPGHVRWRCVWRV